MIEEVEIGTVYRSTTSQNLFLVIAIAQHTETLEPIVVSIGFANGAAYATSFEIFRKSMTEASHASHQ